jgi:hypothetical protein
MDGIDADFQVGREFVRSEDRLGMFLQIANSTRHVAFSSATAMPAIVARMPTRIPAAASVERNDARKALRTA